MFKLNFILFLIKRTPVVIAFIFIGFSFSSIETTDCRLRLRYMSFDKMTENERLSWLFCAYEKLKELSRGKKITKESYIKFVNELNISIKSKNNLLNLTPSKYIGLAKKL